MSRRNNNNLPYDLSILSRAPGPTPEEEQIDRHSHFPPAPDRLPTDQEQGQLEDIVEHAVEDVPWYRTGWGFLAIAFAIVFIIGVVTGGIVGGTHHGSSENGSDVDEGNSIPNNIIGGDGASVNPDSLVTPPPATSATATPA